jgi:hypothetical protein
MYLICVKLSLAKSRHLKFVISTLKCQTWFALAKNVSTPTKKSINYNPYNNSHFLLLQDYFPAVAKWLKLRSYICSYSGMVTLFSCHSDSLREDYQEDGRSVLEQSENHVSEHCVGVVSIQGLWHKDAPLLTSASIKHAVSGGECVHSAFVFPFLFFPLRGRCMDCWATAAMLSPTLVLDRVLATHTQTHTFCVPGQWQRDNFQLCLDNFD